MKWDEYYKMHTILHNLREDISDGDFGFRIQGLLAHTLIRLGFKILEIKPQGHPDIIGEIENLRFKLEVEVALGRASKRIINKEDIDAIKPQNINEKGYFAILDCGLPPEWILIDYKHLKWRISESLFIIVLKSLSDRELSKRCTTQFFHLILSNAERLPQFTFSILRIKALEGEGL
ncbi:MAG: hypothetical protein ACUVXA_13055 [Candidatus Jordarchaeum sp.]|uniref:hypothetical protein n=1 Tax=Candidatus Jordarchaeum sp. TaxID=2823881 RepID=UPI004049422E